MKEKIDQYCRICVNRKIDFQTQHGIICSVTEKEPEFGSLCPNFKQDEKQALKVKDRGIVEPKTRAINWAIDFVVIVILMAIIIPILFKAALFLKGLSAILILGFILLGGTILIIPAYYMLMEAAFGKSVGKFITKTKVVTTDHQKPSFGMIAKRSLLRIIPFVIFIRPEGSPIFFHDKHSGTVVVKG